MIDPETSYINNIEKTEKIQQILLWDLIIKSHDNQGFRFYHCFLILVINKTVIFSSVLYL